MNNINELVKDDKFLKTLLESIPCSVMVVDRNLRIQTINDFLGQTFKIDEDSIINKDKDISDAINCFHGIKAAKSCGQANACANCQVLGAAYEALNGGKVHRKRVKVKSLIGKKWQDLILLVSASPLRYNNVEFAILLLEDVTELSNLRRQTKMQSMFAGLVGQNAKMLDLYESIEELAHVNVPVMIQGESGTGKELVASAIHNEGNRAGKPFIAINCGALPETLLESELFGYVKGAFTGAAQDKRGRFEMADGGTIFLDELGDISPIMQVKLLRVLQEGSFEKIGSEVTTKVDVRVISATNKDLQQEVKAGRIREDLYYRLCVVPLHIPPLRDRRDDIPLLVDHLLKEAAVELNRELMVLSAETLKIMVAYNWPGNIRELQNVIKYTIVKCKGNIIEPAHLPSFVMVKKHKRPGTVTKRTRKRKLNSQPVVRALQKTNGNKLEAAKLLGVSRATLYRFLDNSE